MKVLVIGFALAALALANAQDAHADESTFINDVAARGVYAGPAALTVGHQVCYDVSVNGTAGFDNENQLADQAGVSSHDIGVLVVSAIYDLCPSNMVALNAYLATPNTLHTAV